MLGQLDHHRQEDKKSGLSESQGVLAERCDRFRLVLAQIGVLTYR